MKKITYIIHASHYSEEIGGVLALHKLCDLLRKSGEDAYIWPAHERIPTRCPTLRWHLGFLRRFYLSSRGKYLRTNPEYDTPPATIKNIKNSITIYPEVVSGNPLNSKRVVRWFLNKPGRLTGEVNYGKNELYFYYQEAFNDPAINHNKDNKLLIITIMSAVYKQTNFGQRTGTCYILRKGKERVPDLNSLDGKIVDGLPHKQIAKIFNESEFCVSFDMYTMFSAYAAMCGCKSIIVPEPGIQKQQWQPVHELTYGVAYGEDDLPFATQTRDKMIAKYAGMEEDNLKSVAIFSKKCKEFFSHTTSSPS